LVPQQLLLAPVTDITVASCAPCTTLLAIGIELAALESKLANSNIADFESPRLSATGLVLGLLKLGLGDYQAILDGPLFRGYTGSLPGFAALESYLRLNLPGVNLPSIPSPVTPSLPVRSLPIPRFF
jgi:hypothetical protein